MNQELISTDILLQYATVMPSTTIFAEYCHIHGCKHIFVTGDCGSGENICAHMAHQALALQSHGRILFVAPDVIPENLEHDAFGELCGERALSIGSKNSKIRCINYMVMEPSSAIWISSLDTVARCHQSSKTKINPFDTIYKHLRKNPSDVHLIDDMKYGVSNSTEWKVRSTESKWKGRSAIGKTIRLAYQSGQLELKVLGEILWENGVANRRGPDSLWSQIVLSKEIPSKDRIAHAKIYLSERKPVCRLEEKRFKVPRISPFEYFKTAAVQEEVRKHDRMIVHATSYINRMTPKKRIKWNVTSKQASKQKVFLGISVTNRDVPYINTLIMSLLEGNKPDELNSMFQIHLFNTERRVEHLSFPLWRDQLSKIPLFHLHNFSANSSLTRKGHRNQFFQDTRRGIELCVESKLAWCLLIEEDAVAPSHFTQLFEKFVLQPLKGQENKISVVSLYSYYNLVTKGPHRISENNYASNGYLKDREKSNAERLELGLDPYKASYKIRNSKYHAGTVALLYSKESALKLLDYFRSLGPHPSRDADLYINFSGFFPKFAKKKRRQIFPSLFNHIGFYSSHKKTSKDGNFLTQLNTDVRWIFDAGKVVKK